MLYLISTPIGDKKEITLLAIEVLQKADYLICESFKIGKYWQKKYSPSSQLLLLNEHTKSEEVLQLADLCCSDKKVALISDGGTPVFADPGKELLQILYNSQKSLVIKNIQSILGPSSLMAALSYCPFDIRKFYFAGFLNRDTQKRILEIRKLSSYQVPLVLMDTPYRLQILMHSLHSTFKTNQPAFLCIEMSTEQQILLYGTLARIFSWLKTKKLKKRFILIIDNNKQKSTKQNLPRKK